MIEAVQEWLRAVVVTALLLSVVQTLLPEGNVRRIASFSGGLILMLVLLRPLLGTDLSALELRPTARPSRSGRRSWKRNRIRSWSSS